MFDLRYHVASLAAVFLALIIGILVGVGISGRGLVDEGERRNFEARIDQLERDLSEARDRADEQAAAQTFVDETYPAVINGRLLDRGIVIVFVGSVDGSLRTSVERAVLDASGRRLRMRAVKVPLDFAAVQRALPANAGPVRVRGRDGLDDLGRALAEELVLGGETPLWDALSTLVVEEQAGGMQVPGDGVVVIRSAPPQSGDTARFVTGFYRGLGSVGVPAVGVSAASGSRSGLDAFRRAGFSTVNNVDTPAGRLALALLLDGGVSGDFGVNAEDGLLPRVEVLPPARTAGD